MLIDNDNLQHSPLINDSISAYLQRRSDSHEPVGPYGKVSPPRKIKSSNAYIPTYALLTNKYPINYVSTSIIPDLHNIIQKYQNDHSLQSHEQLLSYLRNAENQQEIRDDLETWLDIYSNSWLKQPALAVIIEAAFLHHVPKVNRVIVDVLSRPRADVDEKVARVAAQRLRYAFTSTNQQGSANVWEQLRQWIEFWEDDTEKQSFAHSAIPASLFVGGREAADWLIQRIHTGSVNKAWISLESPLEWALSMLAHEVKLDIEVSAPLFAATNQRLNFELALRTKGEFTPIRDDFIARAIWTLGALAGHEHLQLMSQLIKSAFTRPEGVDSAAAIHGAMAIVKRWKQDAFKHLVAAFGSEPESLTKFLSIFYRRQQRTLSQR